MLYMPQRASQRKLGKSLKLHLAKQKKQELEETAYKYERVLPAVHRLVNMLKQHT